MLKMMSKTRSTLSKCRRCHGHGIKTAVKGHASRCPYRYCDCHHCEKVVSRRISSTKNRLKHKNEIVFIKMKCLTGNVRVHAVKKNEIDNLRTDNIVSVLHELQEPADSPSTSQSSASPETTMSPTPSLSASPKNGFKPSKHSAFKPVNADTFGHDSDNLKLNISDFNLPLNPLCSATLPLAFNFLPQSTVLSLSSLLLPYQTSNLSLSLPVQRIPPISLPNFSIF